MRVDITSGKDAKHWYALRTTYGREKKAYDYIIGAQGTAFYPTVVVDKKVGGKIKACEVARIPNVFFAYGTEREIQHFVYDNVHLPFLRFYYSYHHGDHGMATEPLIVPDREMRSFRIVCRVTGEDTIVTTEAVDKFANGQKVLVTAGPFAGVEGCVARYKGQQRVGVIIKDVGTAITAYVPTGMMKAI